MCGLRTRPRTDVDPPRVELPSADDISSRRPRNDNWLLLLLLLLLLNYYEINAGVAGRSAAALRVLDGRDGATVLLAAGDPLLHLCQHRRRHLGEAGSGRGRAQQGPTTGRFKAQSPANLFAVSKSTSIYR